VFLSDTMIPIKFIGGVNMGVDRHKKLGGPDRGSKGREEGGVLWREQRATSRQIGGN